MRKAALFERFKLIVITGELYLILLCLLIYEDLERVIKIPLNSTLKNKLCLFQGTNGSGVNISLSLAIHITYILIQLYAFVFIDWLVHLMLFHMLRS